MDKVLHDFDDLGWRRMPNFLFRIHIDNDRYVYY